MTKPKDGAFDSVVEPHDDYPHLMAGPHRRRVAPVGAPAVTRHLVFWNPLDWANYQPRSSRMRSRAIDEAISEIYRTLLALQKKRQVRGLKTNGEVRRDDSKMAVLFDTLMEVQTGSIHERADERNVTGPDAHRTIKLMAKWREIPLTIYFENHVEFVTATIILDLSGYIAPAILAGLRARKRSVLGELCDNFDHIVAGEVGDERQCGKIHAYLYRGIWSRFEKEVLGSLRKDRNQDKLGSIIADFRGLVLGVNYDLRKVGARRRQDQPIIASPFTREPTTAEKNRNRLFNPIWPRDEFGPIWKILSSGVNEDETEFTASQFLRGRAFYATALGEQSGVDIKPRPDPLYYLIYENTANMWQLGRLVYRIHLAGTFRVAAAMHFERLLEVGGGLLQAGTALDQAQRLGIHSDYGDEESIKEPRRQLRRAYEGVEKPLMMFGGIRVDGPIYDRIERSRHYVGQFRQMTSLLRIRRIEGFQPYDEFVYQKLGPVYDYIDRLGRRYVQIQSDRTLLFRRLQALDALYEERVISDAQYVADVALLSILGPYYVGSLLGHIVSEPRLLHEIWLAAVTFGIASFVPITLLRIWARAPMLRHWQAKRDHRAFIILDVVRSRLGRVFIAIVAAGLVVTASRWDLLPNWVPTAPVTDAVPASTPAQIASGADGGT